MVSQLIEVAALPAFPWKNGGGATRTLAIFPPDAGFDDFEWRISIADVTSSADFSLFPGVDRIILLLDGAGMNLHTENGGLFPLATLFEPHKFSGEDRIRSELLDGPTRDFNVMTRRGRAHADVEIFRSKFEVSADHALFYCALGAFRSGEIDLMAGWALLSDKRSICFVPQTTDALMIAVLVTLEYS
jgi:hypothetical protein